MGVMFVYDVQTKLSLQNLSWYRTELNFLVTQLNGDPIPAVLVGNKVTILYCMLSSPCTNSTVAGASIPFLNSLYKMCQFNMWTCHQQLFLVWL